MKSKAYFENGGDYIDFCNTPDCSGAGTLSASTYSYEISSNGYYELSVEETKQLFMSMMNFYLATGDKFWESNASSESCRK